ncbi:MAG: helix-turn-helix transcriptional regulator [Clostridia bacterium]|nr:helix-turn-helix transcriptional regulator [Clostridia bacterium]
MRYSKELVKGSTHLLVLAVLETEDLYGYKICREIELRSQNELSMGEGTLYPILHALEKEDYVESYWRECDGRSRKYYHITRKGLRHLKSLKEERNAFNKSIDKVLNFG